MYIKNNIYSVQRTIIIITYILNNKILLIIILVNTTTEYSFIYKNDTAIYACYILLKQANLHFHVEESSVSFVDRWR